MSPKIRVAAVTPTSTRAAVARPAGGDVCTCESVAVSAARA